MRKKLNRVTCPAPGSIVLQGSWQAGSSKPRKNYPALVYIVSGDYQVNGRLSNYWTWRKLLSKNGTIYRLGRKVSGYGDFYETGDVYSITIHVVKKRPLR